MAFVMQMFVDVNQRWLRRYYWMENFFSKEETRSIFIKGLMFDSDA